MPRTSQVFTKASLVYLCLGSVIGALLLINRSTPLGPAITALRGSHVVLLIFGWLTQLIFGVAWWLFPPLPIGLRPGTHRWQRRGQSQRGSEPLFWVTFACLNTGIILWAVLEALHIWIDAEALNLLAQVLLIVAAIIFVSNGIWARVRELKSR